MPSSMRIFHTIMARFFYFFYEDTNLIKNIGQSKKLFSSCSDEEAYLIMLTSQNHSL